MSAPLVEATHRTEAQVQRYYTWRASNYDGGTTFEIPHHQEAIRTNPPSIEIREEDTSDEHACLCTHPLWWS